MYVVEAEKLEPSLGPNNWIECCVSTLEKASRHLSRLAMLRDLRKRLSVKLYEVPVVPQVWIIAEHVDVDFKDPKHPEASAWKANHKFVSDKRGIIDYLLSIKRRKMEDDGQYCMIHPAGREFFSPFPGHDMMCLLDHEHVDNDFLDSFKRLGYRRLKRLSHDYWTHAFRNFCRNHPPAASFIHAKGWDRL